MNSWKKRPGTILTELIHTTLETDVIVVGLGYSGGCAARAAAEAGARVIGIDSQRKNTFSSYGRDVGHINSDFLRSRGVPEVDPIDLFNEMMRRAGNRANPRLIMRFAQNCGKTFDWFVDMFTPEQLKSLHVAFWPNGATRFKAEKNCQISGYHFWNGTAEFPNRGPGGWSGSPTLTEALLANHAMAQTAGAELLYQTEAIDIITEGHRVTGIIAREKESGEYIRILATQGVILAAGDFAGNDEMMRDLVTDIGDLLPQNQPYPQNHGRMGKGIQLGVWAGGRMEPRPIPVMGGNYPTLPGISTFGVLWLDRNGNRFCNELFGGPEISGFAYNQMPKGTYFNVFDEHIMEDLQWAVPAHGGFDEADPINVAAVESVLRRGRESLANGTAHQGVEFEIEGFHFPWFAHKTFCGRTPEELAANAGLSGQTAKNLAASIRRYNALCTTGRDDDFGKDAKLLRPLSGYLYLQPTEIKNNGFTMTTLGGLVTDENQVVLDDEYEPIPGLYATGNCCGRRFGPQYSTPISGISIGMAITLGRAVGEVAAKNNFNDHVPLH